MGTLELEGEENKLAKHKQKGLGFGSL